MKINCCNPTTHYVTYWIDCFNRSLTVIYRTQQKHVNNKYSEEVLFNTIENAYFEWHEDENADYCCEEFILEQLPKDLDIVAVIYGEEDDELED